MNNNQYQLVTDNAAYSWHENSRPWKVRLEYRGRTKTGRPSEKFWEMYSEGVGHPVFINHGKIGSKGLTNPLSHKGFWEALDVCRDKLRKGYNFVSNSCPHYALPQQSPEPALGPVLCDVYAIRMNGDQYSAHDINGNLLMKLTKTGACELYTMSRFVRDNSPGVHFDSAR